MSISNDNPIPELLEFIDAWVADLTPDHRMESSAIPDFIPTPLRLVYEFTGNYPVPNDQQWRAPNWQCGLFGPQDQLLPIDQLEQNGSRFRFIDENQGVWSCETECDADDPPVFCDSTAYDHGEPEGTMRIVCSSLSHFLTTFCLQEVFFGTHNLFFIDSDVASPQQLVTSDVAPLWVDGRYVWAQPTHSFYTCERGILIMDIGGSFWLAYNDRRFAEFINSSNDVRRIH